jgi:hypothetical protein
MDAARLYRRREGQSHRRLLRALQPPALIRLGTPEAVCVRRPMFHEP